MVSKRDKFGPYATFLIFFVLAAGMYVHLCNDHPLSLVSFTPTCLACSLPLHNFNHCANGSHFPFLLLGENSVLLIGCPESRETSSCAHALIETKNNNAIFMARAIHIPSEGGMEQRCFNFVPFMDDEI